MSSHSTSRGNDDRSLVLFGKNTQPSKLWELWKLVEKSLRDDLLPLDDFSTVSIARQFPQLSPRERYLAPVSVLPFITAGLHRRVFLRPSKAVNRLELMPTTVLSVPRGLTALS